MEPMAPDWRTIGSTPGQGPAPQTGRVGPWSVSTRTIAWLLGAFVAALMLGAFATLLVMPAPGGVRIDAQDVPAQLAVDVRGLAGTSLGTDLDLAAAARTVLLVVDVEGAVLRPGLVEAPNGTRVGDALALAGGFAPNADLAAAAATLNLAQQLTDGLKIVVPAIGDPPTSGDPGSEGVGHSPGRDQGSTRVDLNHASESELDALPGVGPATIAKIVTARDQAPFRSVDELRSRGIVGEATLGKLRDLVTVGG